MKKLVSIMAVAAFMLSMNVNAQEPKKKAKKEKIKLLGKIIKGENIGKEILKFSKNKKIDFIIIGSRGPDPGTESFFGSVANYVIHKSKIPTTIVK